MGRLKKIMVQYPILSKAVARIFNWMNLHKKMGRYGKHTLFRCDGLLQNMRLNILGTNNSIEIKEGSRLKNCSVYINGNNCRICIGENCFLADTAFYIEDDGSSITIKNGTMICGKTQLAAIEQCQIVIGEKCLFSSDIHLRTGDSHPILNLSGARINPSKDIEIADHVWVGNGATILKGTIVPKNSVIGTQSVVTKSFLEENVVIAGNPARIIKYGINWEYHR